MRKGSIFLSMLVLIAIALAACGGGPTSTNVAASPPPVTADSTSTEDTTATETPVATESPVATEPGVPVTGGVNPASVSSQLDFLVLDQSGNQIGEVEDIVLDLDNTRVVYVAVNTSGSAELGDRTILIPWNSLEIQTGTGTGTGDATATAGAESGGGTADATATGTGGTSDATATAGTGAGAVATATTDTGTGGNVSGQGNAFILLTDVSILQDAPDFDLSTLPQMGQPAGDWDADIRTFWESGGATANNTPSPEETAVADTTATVSPNGTIVPEGSPTADQGQATAAPEGTATAGSALQGVVLASDVLGSTITLGIQGQAGQGTTDQATATAGTGGTTDQATATAGTGGTTDQATATAGTDQGTGQGDLSATINDLIVDADTGDIQYIVVSTTVDNVERWIPVPLALFQWGNGAFILNADATMLQNAPFFESGQFPDTTAEGWNGEFDTFWQNSGAGGTGTGSGAEATPTP